MNVLSVFRHELNNKKIIIVLHFETDRRIPEDRKSHTYIIRFSLINQDHSLAT